MKKLIKYLKKAYDWFFTICIWLGLIVVILALIYKIYQCLWVN